MQYFGVPTCPYCKKRVNLIRTWSLKRQGEYQCPRCGGISNIFLSPLIYVFALLAVFAGGAVYFFHKFVLDDISFSTVIQVLIPFAVFFLLSLFMVYLAKPVIKKIPKAELDRKKRKQREPDDRRRLESSPRMFYDDQDYLPRMDYRTGPMPQEDDRDMKVVPSAPPRPAYQEEMQKTYEIKLPDPVPQRQAQPIRTQEPRRTSAQTGRAAPAQRSRTEPRESAPQRVNPRPAAPSVENTTARRQTVTPKQVSSVDVSSVASAPMSNEDFFAKYDDPEYVERRLRELRKNENNGR